jgi:threonine synthase
MAAEAVKNTNGKGIEVSDEEIISAQKILAQEYGILSEPAASASFAGYIKLNMKEKFNGSSMLMITGNGLKDISSLESWNEKPKIESFNKILKENR